MYSYVNYQKNRNFKILSSIRILTIFLKLVLKHFCFFKLNLNLFLRGGNLNDWKF